MLLLAVGEFETVSIFLRNIVFPGLEFIQAPLHKLMPWKPSKVYAPTTGLKILFYIKNCYQRLFLYVFLFTMY